MLPGKALLTVVVRWWPARTNVGVEARNDKAPSEEGSCVSFTGTATSNLDGLALC